MNTDIETVEAMLTEIDDRALALGLPPLSCFTKRDDGDPSPVFFRTAAKYGLRHHGESDGQLLQRYQTLATKAAKARLYGD